MQYGYRKDLPSKNTIITGITAILGETVLRERPTIDSTLHLISINS